MSGRGVAASMAVSKTAGVGSSPAARAKLNVPAWGRSAIETRLFSF